MNNILYVTKPVDAYVYLGTATIQSAIKEALELSMRIETEIILNFNDKKIPCHYRDHTIEDRLALYFN